MKWLKKLLLNTLLDVVEEVADDKIKRLSQKLKDSDRQEESGK